MAIIDQNTYEKYEPFFHLLFWLGYLVLLTTANASLGDLDNVIARNALSCLSLAVLVYFNFWYLTPRYFKLKKYIAYYGLLIVAVVIVSVVRIFVDKWLIEEEDALLLASFEFITLPHFANTILSSIIMLFITSSIKYHNDWNRQQRTLQELKAYQLEAELKFLQTQINPHFLFNALNNVYALQQTGSKEAGPMVMRLSEMLRYMLYTSESKKVPLKKELEYVQHYIDFQQLKKAKKQQIDFKIEGDSEGVEIAPMILIPFFENSFKHGNVDDLKNGWLKSRLRISPEIISFTISNSVGLKPRQKDKVGGIGLENVKKRLQLLYPKKHQLDIQNKTETFSVHLLLNRDSVMRIDKIDAVENVNLTSPINE